MTFSLDADYPDFSGKGTPPCQTNPDLFFPDPTEKGNAIQAAVAKEVCFSNGGCPYLAECFSWAMAKHEPGVWGGTSENDRSRIRRKRITGASRQVPVSIQTSRPSLHS